MITKYQALDAIAPLHSAYEHALLAHHMQTDPATNVHLELLEKKFRRAAHVLGFTIVDRPTESAAAREQDEQTLGFR
jgi:hypothetical protein